MLYQARQAQGRGYRFPRLVAALSAIEAGAIEGRRPAAGPAGEPAPWIMPGGEAPHPRFSPAAQNFSPRQSHAQLTSAWMRARIQAGYRRARLSLPEVRAAWGEQIDDAFAEKLKQYTGQRGHRIDRDGGGGGRRLLRAGGDGLAGADRRAPSAG